MKSLTILAATAAAATLVTSAVSAQTAAPAATAAPAPVNVVVGAKVADTKGGEVGTIDAVSGDLATLSTGTNKVQLPKTSFAAGTGGGLIIAMTKAEVDAAASGAAETAKADLAASLKPGTKVSDSKGGVAGTIESADAQFVTVATGNSKVKLPVSALRRGKSGPMIAMTAAELDAAAKGAAPGGS